MNELTAGELSDSHRWAQPTTGVTQVTAVCTETQGTGKGTLANKWSIY